MYSDVSVRDKHSEAPAEARKVTSKGVLAGASLTGGVVAGIALGIRRVH